MHVSIPQYQSGQFGLLGDFRTWVTSALVSIPQYQSGQIGHSWVCPYTPALSVVSIPQYQSGQFGLWIFSHQVLGNRNKKSQSLNTNQGNSDIFASCWRDLPLAQSQSLNTNQGNSDRITPNTQRWPTRCSSQSLNTNQGNSDSSPAVTQQSADPVLQSLNPSIPIRAIRTISGKRERRSCSRSLNPSIPIRAIRTRRPGHGRPAARCVSIPQYQSGQFGRYLGHEARARRVQSQSLNTNQGNSDSQSPSLRRSRNRKVSIPQYQSGQFGQ